MSEEETDERSGPGEEEDEDEVLDVEDTPEWAEAVAATQWHSERMEQFEQSRRRMGEAGD